MNKKNNNLIISTNIPKISIFLPIYNKEKYLIRSIASIQNQTLKNIEIIAVNDGSTDNSLKILKNLTKKDKRIKIINNDRNHGLLYSRAMGILNSSGEYVINLDPDDKFSNSTNLEQLYNITNNSKYDFIIFLIKRLSTNYKENYYTNLENKLQLQKQDFRITNKLIKRKKMLIVYEYYKKYINGNKWNYHDDNIWNLLIRQFSTRIKIFNEYIYIYKRNNESLNMNKGNIIDIKNRIYRLELLINLQQKLKKKLYYYNLYFFLNDIISICNASFLSNEKEIKKGISKISIDLLNTFKNETQISNNINNILNKISNNKIILFYHKNNQTSIIPNFKLSLFKFLKENRNKIIIPIDLNNNTQINNIINYIYLNDVLVGIINIIYLKKFKMIINPFYNYKIVIFNLDKTMNRSIINSSNIIFFD